MHLPADTTGDVLTVTSLTHGLEFVSDSIRQWGHDPAELLGASGVKLVHPDDRASFISKTAAALNGEQIPPDGRVHRFKAADGWRWFEDNPRPIRDADGNITAMVNVLRDVTDRVSAKSALEQSERRYRLLAENSADIDAIFGANTRFTYLSPSIERVLGYRPDELIGHSIEEITHPDDFRRAMQSFSDHMNGPHPDQPFSIVYRAMHKDGREVWLSAHPRAIFAASGALVGFQDIVRDISDQVALQTELERAKLAAEAAAQAKAEFLANMSHELRTPLTSIIGFSNLLQGHLDDEGHRFAALIRTASQSLLGLVNDILDFSKLEAGQVEIERRVVDPIELTEMSVGLLAPQAETKRLTLCFKHDNESRAAVLLDDTRIRQVLLNLVGNSVKFTVSGRVTVALSRPGAGRLRWEVRDTGPGIAEDRRGLLFRRFSQVDASTTRTFGGTGLGLAICKGLVEAMGGSIGVDSTPGAGSTFWFELPAEAAGEAADAPGAVPWTTLESVRILVVDDNAANREIAARLLTVVGAELQLVESGEEAVAIARIVPLDAILMDLRMPGMGGAEAARAIRTMGGPNSRIPILAFTADAPAFQATREHASFDGVIAKPIIADRLFATLAAALPVRNTVAAGGEAEPRRFGGRSAA